MLNNLILDQKSNENLNLNQTGNLDLTQKTDLLLAYLSTVTFQQQQSK